MISHARVSFPGETHELGLGPKWAQEYLEQSIDHPTSIKSEFENPDFAYSKFMKFMRQEGDIPIETGAASKVESEDKWISEFTEVKSGNTLETVNKEPNLNDASTLSAIDEQSAAAGSWLEEFNAKNDKPAGK